MRGEPNRHRGRRWAGWSAAVVVAAAALVATLPGPPRAADTPAQPIVEPVASTVLSCPPGASAAVVAVASAALERDGAAARPDGGDGRGDIAVEQPGGDTRTASPPRGELVTLGVEPAPVEVTATGPTARGLMAIRKERVAGTLATAGCDAARAEWWFAGAGGGVDHKSVLTVTNPDAGPAVVDVRLHGASGSVDEAGLRGVTLSPGEVKRLPLTLFAPGSGELAVEVSATRGRVVADVIDSIGSGRGKGREWLPPTTPPARELVLPGVPADADRVQLLVTNPGSEQALVDLELLTERGAFVPLGNEQLSVDPRTIERIDLTEVLKGRAAAVRLSALVPVTAAVRWIEAGDVAYATAGGPLDRPGGVVLAGNRSTLQVAAGDEAVAVRLELLGEDGRRLVRRAVTVPPSGLARVPVPEGAAYAVLLPSTGGGHAAAVHHGPGVAVQPVAPLPATLLRPTVVPYAGQSDS